MPRPSIITLGGETIYPIISVSTKKEQSPEFYHSCSRWGKQRNIQTGLLTSALWSGEWDEGVSSGDQRGRDIGQTPAWPNRLKYFVSLLNIQNLQCSDSSIQLAPNNLPFELPNIYSRLSKLIRFKQTGHKQTYSRRNLMKFPVVSPSPAVSCL